MAKGLEIRNVSHHLSLRRDIRTEDTSGHASTCPTGKLLIDNLSKGFDLYDLPRSSPSQTFYAPSVKRCVKDGAFAEKASAIVCGSDHGKVYIFTKSSSDPIQVLSAAGKTVDVQAISVRKYQNQCPRHSLH